MYWLTEGLRVVSFRSDQVSWQHSMLRETSLKICIETEKLISGLFLPAAYPCSLFPRFGDPWPSFLLPSYYHTIALISHVSKVMLKIHQTRLQQYMN